VVSCLRTKGLTAAVSVLLGASWLPVITIYPFMKRITHWPQGVLGTTLVGRCFSTFVMGTKTYNSLPFLRSRVELGGLAWVVGSYGFG